MILRGKVHKYGANVDTDAIVAARYLNVSTAEELGRYCMQDIDQGFIQRVEPGDIIVATSNFGCGSSREHAPMALKGAGISCVIAESFARIFFRNSINIGLPILESPQVAKEAEMGHTLEVDLATGEIRNTDTGSVHQARPFPPFMLEIIEAGGLIPYVQSKTDRE
jgi:3-isopropylmalate/(R)-2-methylmalate dehydratase small subunit